MRLRSPHFSNQGRIPHRFTCDGEDVSPALEWDDVPEGTAQLALTCEDPDAPRKPFVHWAIWGIAPDVKGLASGETPEGTSQGASDAGVNGYSGPCPPPGHGAHRYHFTLYALREPISLQQGASIEALRRAMEDKVLAQATLVGTYGR